MNTGLTEFRGVGIAAILLGVAALTSMVHKELGPFAGLEPPGKWMLTAALGMGLFAFGLKMAVALAISESPQNTVVPLAANNLAPTAANRDGTAEFTNPAPSRPLRHIWETLPERVPAPADNPMTPAKVALGKRLFYETRLSGNGILSCSSCHDLYDRAGGDERPTAEGIRGQIGPRNAPTVWNAAFQSVLFWDGRAPSQEAQAKGPILNPIEMGMGSPAEPVGRLSRDKSYRTDFAKAFGGDGTITFDRIAQAIATFERTLVTADSPYDRSVRGDASALSPPQLRGMALFESVGCILCHRGPNFSDASLVGGENPLRFFPANPTPYEDKYKLLGEDGKRGIWRIPSLRNVALTGPWFHNGSVDTLEEAVRVMASAQLGRSGRFMTWLDQDKSLARVDHSPLSDRDIGDIVAFLESLSSDSLRARRKQGS